MFLVLQEVMHRFSSKDTHLFCIGYVDYYYSLLFDVFHTRFIKYAYEFYLWNPDIVHTLYWMTFYTENFARPATQHCHFCIFIARRHSEVMQSAIAVLSACVV